MSVQSPVPHSGTLPQAGEMSPNPPVALGGWEDTMEIVRHARGQTQLRAPEIARSMHFNK